MHALGFLSVQLPFRKGKEYTQVAFYENIDQNQPVPEQRAQLHQKEEEFLQQFILS